MKGTTKNIVRDECRLTPDETYLNKVKGSSLEKDDAITIARAIKASLRNKINWRVMKNYMRMMDALNEVYSTFFVSLQTFNFWDRDCAGALIVYLNAHSYFEVMNLLFIGRLIDCHEAEMEEFSFQGKVICWNGINWTIKE